MDKIARIRHYRQTLEIGLATARRMVEREDILAEIDAVGTIADLKSVLRKVVEGMPC